MNDTIYMIHGMWGGSWCWDNYRRMLESAAYQCMTPTLPYHDMEACGVPDSRLGTMSLLDYAQTLEREIEQLSEAPIVMGHSMGGLLAQMLGARGRAKALVLLTPAAPAGILAITPSVIRSFWNIQTRWGWWRKPTRPTFAEASYSILHLLPEIDRKRVYDKFVYESGRATFEIGYWFFDRRGAAEVDAASITCPVLVVGCSQDRITPARIVRKVARRYEAVSTYREFENHAHWVVGEPQWEEIATCVVDWLDARAGCKLDRGAMHPHCYAPSAAATEKLRASHDNARSKDA